MEDTYVSGGDELGDDFYEQIEAPKFVDLTAPDRFRSDNDDRYWFCLRVGCDQKHEEELDSESIYKNFVLRVMAARSPNVRLRKALCRKHSSANVKCPLTVPAKPSKSRVSRLALISSISLKKVDPTPKTRPVPEHNTATPDTKKKQSCVKAKALTTPRNRKRLSNPGTFRSVRNPKPTSVAVPKSRMVAKALVFQSPKKPVKTKISTELSALCKGMKKLEITSVKKNSKPLTLESSKRQLRGREVKSRVFDPLGPKQCWANEVKSMKCLKKKKKEKETELAHDPARCETTKSDDSSDMEIEEKSRNGSLEVCSTSDASKTNGGNETEDCLLPFKNDGETISDTSRTDTISSSNYDVKENEEKTKVSPVKNEENKNNLASDDKENEGEIMNGDNKENASASDDNNRKENPNISHMEKKKTLGQHKASKSIAMASKGMGKASKGNLASAATCAEGVNYRKPKLTNPKPFRLRTDERQILKEANLGRKQHLTEEPLKEINTVKLAGGNQQRKHQKAVQRTEKCLEQTENEGSERESERKRKDQPLKMGSTTPQKRIVALHNNPNLEDSQEKHGLDKSAKKNKETLKRTTKSPCTKQLARSKGIESSRKKTNCIKLGVIKESSPTIIQTKIEARPLQENGATPITKDSVSGASRSSSARRRAATVPKEPHFHNVHRPKSCCTR